MFATDNLPLLTRTLPLARGGLGRGILLCVAFFFQIGIIVYSKKKLVVCTVGTAHLL